VVDLFLKASSGFRLANVEHPTQQNSNILTKTIKNDEKLSTKTIKNHEKLSTKTIKNDDLNSQESGYVVGQWISVRTI